MIALTKIRLSFVACILSAALLSSCLFSPVFGEGQEGLGTGTKIRDEEAPGSEESFFRNKAEKGFKAIYLVISYDLKVVGNTERIVFRSVVPADYPPRQKILNIAYYPEPVRVFTSGDNKYAEFVIENPSGEHKIDILCRLQIYNYGLSSAIESGLDQKFEINRDLYLKEERYIEVNDPIIIENHIVKKEADDQIDKVRAIYDYVIEQLTYSSYNTDSVGAAKALISGRGDCTEFTDTFVALCRASGLPARSIEGYFLSAKDLHLGHNWPEVYLEDIGWVPFDPTLDTDGKTSFYSLQNDYVYLSFRRNDPILKGFHYYFYHSWGDEIEVSKNIEYFIQQK